MGLVNAIGCEIDSESRTGARGRGSRRFLTESTQGRKVLKVAKNEKVGSG